MTGIKPIGASAKWPSGGSPAQKKQAVQFDLLKLQMSQWLERSTLKVPGIPAVIVEAMQLANDPDADVKKLEALILKDQAVSGRLLQLVNSPALRGAGEIKSIRGAIVRLGQRELRMALLGSFVQMTVFKSKHYGGLVEKLWTHSLGCGSIARFVAGQLGKDPEEAYLAGLLHDVGKVALLGTVVAKKKEAELLPESLMERLLNNFHAYAGMIVARTWNLPAQVSDAIKNHHNFEQSKEDIRFTAVIQIADVLTHLARLGQQPEEIERYDDPDQPYVPLKVAYLRAKAMDLSNYVGFGMFSFTLRALRFALCFYYSFGFFAP